MIKGITHNLKLEKTNSRKISIKSIWFQITSNPSNCLQVALNNNTTCRRSKAQSNKKSETIKTAGRSKTLTTTTKKTSRTTTWSMTTIVITKVIMAISNTTKGRFSTKKELSLSYKKSILIHHLDHIQTNRGKGQMMINNNNSSS